MPTSDYLQQYSDLYNQTRSPFDRGSSGGYGSSGGSGSTQPSSGGYQGHTPQGQYQYGGGDNYGQSPSPGVTGYGRSPFETLEMGGSGPGFNQQLRASMEIPRAPFTDLMAAAGLSDYQNLIEAEKFNRARGDAQIAQYGNILEQIPEQIQGTASRVAGDVRQQGTAAREAMVTDVDEAIADFDKTQHAEMSSAGFGIAKATQSDMAKVNAGMNPDGTQMTPAQKSEALAQAKFNNAAQRQAALAPMVTDYEKSMLQARISGAGVKGQGYSLEAQAGQAAAQIENMGAVQATQYLMTGQENMYQMVKNNPYQPVALLDTLAAIHSMKSKEPMSPWEQIQMPSEQFFTQGLSGQLPFATQA